ncbi:c-type cytochrome [Paraglaciecola aquimarina]|uniref:C-type cytochrome n=1 Tax=Paraglaciecola aquimarina TaxID=1235557 RepID=A0ABU3T2K4_9ALTE|nr:c-type cytochrome [Paraglaciecola aquimarina]MDU0356438.1 c-type cytochrome [Paraglaciecola aquimarina]
MNLFQRKIIKPSVGLALLGLTLQSAQTLSTPSEGQTLFETTCAACHGKDLSGGAGFNLKDETWVHGSQPDDILANIKKGFGQAGMPGFAGVYSEPQLKSIVDYVLSKRQGFDNLTYKIYHLDDNAPASFAIMDKLEVAKSGPLTTNLMDFAMPEAKDYIIEFEGDLYAPKENPGQIFAMIYKEMFELEIDGQVIKPSKFEWLQVAWPIKAGKQHVKIRYSTVGTRANHNKQFSFFVANQDLTQKLFGISTPGKQFLNNATVNVKAETQPQVVRKKIVNLPVSSVAVGFPEKINYAFNTKNCTINGAWTGDLLNVGPNIEGRGRDGGVILGDWLFHSPQGIAPESSNCIFTKYNRQGNPSFVYEIDGNQYSVQVSPQSANALTFTYTLLQGSNSRLMLNLPEVDKANFTSQEGKITNNQFSVPLKVGQSYAISLTLKGSK